MIKRVKRFPTSMKIPIVESPAVILSIISMTAILVSWLLRNPYRLEDNIEYLEKYFPAISILSNQHTGAIIPLNRLCCWFWTISIMLLMRAHRRCWYHCILVLHSTPSTTPFTLVDYKPASAYLGSPLHGSDHIVRGTVKLSVLAFPRLHLLPAPLAFRKDLSLVPWFFPYSSYPLHILSVNIASCSSSMLTTLSSMSKYNYNTPVAKLELCFLTLPTWFCYKGLALHPDKFEAIVFCTTQRSHSLPITSTVNVAGILVQVSNQARILGVTLDSRLSFDA